MAAAERRAPTSGSDISDIIAVGTLPVGPCPCLSVAEVDFDGSENRGRQNICGPLSLVAAPEICLPCAFNAWQSLNSVTTIGARRRTTRDDAALLYAAAGVALGGAKVPDQSFLDSSESDVATKRRRSRDPWSAAISHSRCQARGRRKLRGCTTIWAS